MAYEKVKAYFERIGQPGLLRLHTRTIDTVEHAAMEIGCEEAQIAKTLSFLVSGQPVLVVMAGDGRVNSAKFKAVFHEKPRMIPRDKVQELVGHEPGGVCPFAVNEGIKIYLDVSMKRFEVVHAAAGSDFATVSLSIQELEEFTAYSGWVDICKGWEA